MTRRWAVLTAILFVTSATADDNLDDTFDRDILIIQASAYACHRIDAFIAKSNEQRARGLMHVKYLPATSGMLFVYDGEDYISMWMKNTYISLDMVFVHRDGRVSSVANDTEPLSLRSISSIEAVRYVLELNAGTAQRLSIDENSILLWDANSSDE